jgi:hypothetical protein
MPNYYLGKTHNQVERNDVGGRKILDDRPVTHAEFQAARGGRESRSWRTGIKDNLF